MKICIKHPELLGKVTMSGECNSCKCERRKLYRETHKQQIYEQNKIYVSQNRDKIIERKRDNYNSGPEVRRLQNKHRREIKKLAMPAWVNKNTIASIYFLAKKLREETGVMFHIDHVIPLQNEFVCGLHVPNNLRIITAKENYSKAARWGA